VLEWLSGPISAYDFQADLGGCVMAYSAGQYYSGACISTIAGSICVCSLKEAKWYSSPTSDGQICKERCGWLCENVHEGKWDASDSKCIDCDGRIDKSDYKCESACGASKECDEQTPGTSLPPQCTSTVLEVNRQCDSSCIYSSTRYYCDSSQCGVSQVCGGLTYYCVYDNGWKWSTSKPSNFCCSDSDCSGYDPNAHLKMYCDTNTHTCKTIEKCGKK
jgi:hypothetical protein